MDLRPSWCLHLQPWSHQVSCLILPFANVRYRRKRTLLNSTWHYHRRQVNRCFRLVRRRPGAALLTNPILDSIRLRKGYAIPVADEIAIQRIVTVPCKKSIRAVPECTHGHGGDPRARLLRLLPRAFGSTLLLFNRPSE